MHLSKSSVTAFFFFSVVTFGLIIYQHTSNTLPEQKNYAPIVPETSSSSSSASSAPIILNDDPNIIPREEIPKDHDVDGVCGSKVPSTWHVRSSEDQAIWNREGNRTITSTITANDFFQGSWFNPPLRPALWSIAAEDVKLVGHAEDPGAEDGNRLELDVLSMSETELEALLSRLDPAPDQFAWKTVRVDGYPLRVIRNVQEDDKYYGQELVFVPAKIIGGKNGLILFNRSNYGPDFRSVAFREAVSHFLETLHFRECPKEWLR